MIYGAHFFSYEPPPHPLVTVFIKEKPVSSWLLILSLVVACVIGPAVEELFFRGFLYPALRKYIGRFSTLVVTAALFAALHENWFSFLPIFFLGLVLGYLYEKRGSLLSCMTLHMVHNTTFLIYFFLMKDILVASGGAS